MQPFLALGQKLKDRGHRVRIATHATFEEFVRDAGLEFFNIGGNPQDLMSYMVKSRYFDPNLPASPTLTQVLQIPGLCLALSRFATATSGGSARCWARYALSAFTIQL